MVSKLVGAVMALLVAVLLGGEPAEASHLVLGSAEDLALRTLALEGSDATGLHRDTTYTGQLGAFLRAGRHEPILVLGTVDLGFGGLGFPGDTVYVSEAGLAAIIAAGDLHRSDFSALYIQSPGACCTERHAGAAPFQADIGAFYGEGGSLAIQDYGGRDWGAALPFPTPPPGAVRGFDTAGGTVGTFCWDSEVFTADALAKGFTQPPVLGCWAHQAYDTAYFGDASALGLSAAFLSLVDSGPAHPPGFSSFLALGGGLGTVGGCPTCPPGDGTPGVPEPATLLLLGAGLLVLACWRNLRRVF
ncbi:MAG: PEP-CTERM sorting domain-containing protein [Candidatus Rokubacteria bacterium]|nr:PEP-CTERM sorting domain-containing protein [Candidatus Rokubacteria bacterium]MBI3108701.1 PEP-CTERM sorting domain-containing protein [Candidatus Rokubacteria bacterium]